MNPESNRFEPLTPETPKEWMRIRVGEQVKVRDYMFRVEDVEPDRLVLTPVGPTVALSRRLRRAEKRRS